MAETHAPSRNWIGVLIVFTTASFVETLFYGQIMAFTPLYLPKLGIRPLEVAAWTGAIVAISNIAGLPFLPFWGALADRYSRKPIIVRSFVVEIAGGAIMLASGNIWIFAVGRTLLSLSLGNSGLMMTTLSERVPENKLGLAFSIMNGSSPLGGFLGPLIGGPIVDRFGFPGLLLLDTFLIFAVILSLVYGYQETFRGRSGLPILHMAVDSLLLIKRSAHLRLLMTAMFLLFSAWMMVYTYAPLVVERLHPGDRRNTVVGIVMGLGGLATALLSPLIGALSDRHGHGRTLVVAAASSIALWSLPAFARDLTFFAASWMILNGVASSLFAVSFTFLSSSVGADVRARIMSFAYLPFNVACVIGPALGSAITRHDLYSVFPAASILTAAGVLVLVVALRRVGVGPASANGPKLPA